MTPTLYLRIVGALLSVMLASAFVGCSRPQRILTVERIEGVIEQVFDPSMGTCSRCWRPWNRVKSHTTWFESYHGMFTLCETCWHALSPTERWPYYRDILRSWPEPKISEGKLEQIVLAEKFGANPWMP
jgi:hypothetical protein